jgi:hypothetical protein
LTGPVERVRQDPGDEPVRVGGAECGVAEPDSRRACHRVLAAPADAARVADLVVKTHGVDAQRLRPASEGVELVLVCPCRGGQCAQRVGRLLGEGEKTLAVVGQGLDVVPQFSDLTLSGGLDGELGAVLPRRWRAGGV